MTEVVTAAMAAHVRQTGEPRLAPDGRAVAYAQSYGGRGDLLMSRVSGAHPEPPVAVTTDPTVPASVSYGGGLFTWAGADSLVFVGTDGALHRVDAVGGAPRRLTGAAGFAAPCVSGAEVVCMRTQRDAQDIAIVDLDGHRWPARLSGDADFCFDPDLTADGRAAWHEWDVPDMAWDGGRIVLRMPDGRRTVDGGDGVSVAQPRFSPDGRMLAYLSDRSGWQNLWIADGAGGSPRHLVAEDAEHGTPTWSPGNRSFAWSPDGGEIAFASSSCARTTLRVVDVATGSVRTLDEPAGVYSELTWAGDYLCGLYTDHQSPAQVRLIDPRSGAWRAVSQSGAGRFPAFGSADHVTWEGGDGGAVHGILVRPSGAEGPGPLLVWVHGGPTGQATLSFNGRLHFFAARGWSVLFVNHRGSTGYGQAYTQALRGRWGELDVDDVASGVRHFVRVDLADPDRVAIMGASAGGYTVLLSLAAHPDLFAAGVSLYGVADLFRLAETTHRFEAHYTDSLVGPLPGAYAQYSDRSPITHAARIRSPLLVLQGSADDVVPAEQASMIVDRVRATGTTVDYHVYEGEGHGWGRTEVQIDEIERIEAFLRRHVLHTAR